MNVRPYRPDDAAAWDAFVAAARAPHFLFARGYMDYHADRFEDASLLVEEGERLLAVLPANRSGTMLWSHEGLTFGGLVTGEAMTARRALAAFDALVGHLREAGVSRVIYKSVPHIYHAVPAEEDRYALFRHGARLVRRDLSSSIRLERPLPYRKGRKAALKQARGSGLELRQSDDFEAFMAIENQALARHGVTAVHTPAELELLAGRFPEGIRLHVAEAGGELVAGVVVYETEVVAHAQYIGASERGRELGALDVLLDDRIAAAAADARRWFDFGISTTEQGRSLNEGLVRNKESYGARGITYDWYELAL